MSWALNMKQLLIDTMLFDVAPAQLNESKASNNGRVIVTGILQRHSAKNQNGRIYPKEILMREVKKYMSVQIKENRALGELDHPDSSIINLKNVSHNVLGVSWKGSDLIGKIEILPTPSGNILQNLLSAGIRLGISSRGMGSVTELSEGTVEVQDDFELIGWDFVSNPSTQGAFMHPVQEGLLRESAGMLSPAIDKPSAAVRRINENITQIICEIGDVCECIFDNTNG